MAMEQMARNATLEELGFLHPCQYLLHDRDTKFCESFRESVEGRGSKAVEVASQESESERIRGEMGAIGKRGMFVEVDSVWRVFAEEGGHSAVMAKYAARSDWAVS